MQSGKTNVIVYVRQPVQRVQKFRIAEAIGSLNGVSSAVSSPHAHGMICIDYDLGRISSGQILQCAESQGVDARLVGM
jgi:hypothetical protein